MIRVRVVGGKVKGRFDETFELRSRCCGTLIFPVLYCEDYHVLCLPERS